MYVCICNAVTDKDIRRAARQGANTLYELQDRLGVAACCGSCADQASEILEQTQARRRPLRPVLYHVMHRRERYDDVVLLYGAREPAGLLYSSEYATWREHGIQVELTVDSADPSWSGHIGVVPRAGRRPPA